ncbi:Crp/Fnr family transcriptional regulator [Lachnospira multipara]|uniref:Crp/Fnr family transcriptional regulator n=1 Tax=Lachnospira multipara TaxID=28051 RepID=UPI00047F4E8E|nr:Crp/Fnr family transcriptional regulator [Lachnospira multipara]
MDKIELMNNPLFNNLTDTNFKKAMTILNPTSKKYHKGTIILRAGETTTKLGIVLSGSVNIESNDIWGNRSILNHINKGQLFAEVYALLNPEIMLVDVIANTDCEILFLDISKLLSITGTTNSNFNKQITNTLLNNLLTITARKNLQLSKRSFHTAKKTIRSRVMSYLNSVSLQAGTNDFSIPYNRQQLADYLNLERTALSKELGKMKKDGLISFHKNHFKILDT